MKKRTLSIVLLFVFVLSMMLTACGNAASTDESKQPEATSAATAQNADGKTSTDAEETLTVWCWDPNYNINAMNIAEEIYQKDHPNFNLEVIEINQQDIMQKLATAATTGQIDVLPDILLVQDAYFQMFLASYPDVFAELTDYEFKYDEFSANKVGFSTVDGKRYGIPFDSGTAIACYRTDVLEAAGYTIEDFTDITWSEWIEKAKVVLDKTGVALLTGQSSYNQINIMLQSAGGSYFNEDGSANLTNNPALRKTVETYIEMVQAGVYVEETAWDTYIGGLNTGRIGGAMNGCWIMASIEAAEDQSGKWAITNLPKLDDIDSATNYSSQGGATWAVTSNCKNVALAVDFFQATFGGSTELYDRILSTGAISTWLPAAGSDEYNVPDPYFSNQPVFAMITEYSADVPVVEIGVYSANANSIVASAITNVLYNGTSIDDELKAAEETLIFEMQ